MEPSNRIPAVVLMLLAAFVVFVLTCLVSLCVVAALVLLTRGRDVVAGELMAIAIGTKFIPVVMLPFLIFFRGRVRWRYGISLWMMVVLMRYAVAKVGWERE